jgi:molybdate transport system ATP-binding protein
VLDAVVARHDRTFKLTTLATRAGELQVPQLAADAGAAVRVYIRSRDVMLSLQQPQEISALNVLHGRVAQIARSGAQADVRLDCNGATLVARLTAKSVQRLALATGRPVFAVIKSVSFERS